MLRSQVGGQVFHNSLELSESLTKGLLDESETVESLLVNLKA